MNKEQLTHLKTIVKSTTDNRLLLIAKDKLRETRLSGPNDERFNLFFDIRSNLINKL